MAIKLHQQGLRHAKSLIKADKVSKDQRDDWSEHQPSTAEENKLIEREGLSEFGAWHLGIRDDEDKDTKGAYAFPIGDFKAIHRCAVVSAKVRAAQFDHRQIEEAADELLQLIDKEE